jgi:hypothetical protein
MGQQPQDMPMDGMPPMDPQAMGGDPMMQDQGGMPPMDENRIVKEIVDDLVNGRHTGRNEKKITNDEVSERNPFRFK